MEGFDDTPELPEGLTPPPASVEGGDPAAEAPEAEYVSLKNRGEEVRMTRATAQAAADELGITVDDFVRRNQIGWDGTRLYNDFEEWRNQQMSEIEAERRRIRAESGARTPQPVSAPPGVPARSRPNQNDVVGTVNWLADRIEAIESRGGEAEELKGQLAEFMGRIEEKEMRAERVEEWGYANQVHGEVKAQWKKEFNGFEPPSMAEIQRYLQRVSIQDDPNKGWHDIINEVAYALRGPALIRHMKRQTTSDLTKPNARVLVPAGNRSSSPAAVPRTGNEEQDIAAMEQALNGVPASVLLPGIRD